MRQINGHTHQTPPSQIELTEEIEIEMQSQREILWHAKTDDSPPVEFSLVDESPDGLAFIIEEGEHEIGVTVGGEDVPAIIDAIVGWHITQNTKIVVTESVTGPRDLTDDEPDDN